jgi:hypothetical protein
VDALGLKPGQPCEWVSSTRETLRKFLLSHFPTKRNTKAAHLTALPGSLLLVWRGGARMRCKAHRAAAASQSAGPTSALSRRCGICRAACGRLASSAGASSAQHLQGRQWPPRVAHCLLPCQTRAASLALQPVVLCSLRQSCHALRQSSHALWGSCVVVVIARSAARACEGDCARCSQAW